MYFYLKLNKVCIVEGDKTMGQKKMHIKKIILWWGCNVFLQKKILNANTEF